MTALCAKFLFLMVLIPTNSHLMLPSQCDDRPWSDQTTHVPGGNGTKQTAYSWHIHYMYGYLNVSSQDNDVAAFGAAFCQEFAKFGESGTCIDTCKFGPNYIGEEVQYICSSFNQCNCDGVVEAEESHESTSSSCGNGTCIDPVFSPFPVCQKNFHVAAKFIDHVTAWVAEPMNRRSLVVMRHPNTGCQWGDHSTRAEFVGGVAPEICLWNLPCNSPGEGCEKEGCGALDGTHKRQHSPDCVLEVLPTVVV